MYNKPSSFPWGSMGLTILQGLNLKTEETAIAKPGLAYLETAW